MSHLGFGRKALHGAPDVGILIPGSTTLGCGSAEKRAASMEEALGNCNATHGGWGVDNACGDHLRAAIINDALDSHFWHIVGHERNLHNDHPHAGFPNFAFWPHHSSILHQQMWWEWIKRAHEGGLRVLVALTVNSETLAEVLNGDRPWDDVTVANTQIAETARFVRQHEDFMAIAHSATEAETIIRSNRIAVILGMEVDKLGNFGKPGVRTDEAAVKAEIKRLYDQEIRYVFPIHLIDNAFGGSAMYKMLMNMANRHQNGNFFSILHSNDPNVTYGAHFVSEKPGEDTLASAGFYSLLEIFGHLPAPCGEFWKGCAPFTVGCCGNYQNIKRILTPTFQWDAYKTIPPGHVNAKGLTRLGEVALQEMMRLGMIVDVDHMSELALRRTVEIAEGIRDGYPLVLGHNGIRGPLPGTPRSEYEGNERSAPMDVAQRIAALGGMMGAGTAESNPTDFINNYRRTYDVLKTAAAPKGQITGVGLGTDANGFETLPHRGPGNKFSADKVALLPGDAWNQPPAQLSCEKEPDPANSKISIRSARIGCLDIQRDANMTNYVTVSCNGKRKCTYKAPSEAEYRKMGVTAATRTFCTQAMEIVYRCVSRPTSAVTSANFYSSFFRDSGVKDKQKKPSGGEWDYIQEGGVSHYGLLPEFLHEVRQSDASVYENVMASADTFVQMWKKIDRVKNNVGSGPAEGTFRYTFEPITGLCPFTRVTGDTEFGGHGPRVRGQVRLAIDPTGARVKATITFNAKETAGDGSEVRGEWTVNVGEPAPSGMRYSAIVGPTVGAFEQVLVGGGRNEVFEGCDGGEHQVSITAGSNPFGRMLLVGDTGGGDISTDANCNCDTRINSIVLEPVSLTLTRR
jgi:microsomal dipeptidase-like Zn-dependent dipeptidase